MGWGRPGEQGQCQECTRSESWPQNVRKNAAHKESSREKSHVRRAKFNGRLKPPGWSGKYGAAQTLGHAWLLYKGNVKEVRACMGVSGRGGAVLEQGSFC
jgi:hypothetical protein